MSPARSHAARLPQPVDTRLPVEAPPPRPFLKWAGGKRRLAPLIEQHLPPSFGTYHEPFAGGAAVFFHLQPRQAVLSDMNDRLVRAWPEPPPGAHVLVSNVDTLTVRRLFSEGFSPRGSMRGEPWLLIPGAGGGKQNCSCVPSER
jgi:hypothetical protein